MNPAHILCGLACALLLGGCASSHHNPQDPFEPLNRSVYQVNDTLDRAIAKPLSQGYASVMPAPAKTMVSNFFGNLDDVLVTANDLLQFKFRQAFSDGGRVLINSTVGVFGLIDVASRSGLERHNEDFGQTLGYWGVGSGPYLVLPVLGPSSLRDASGLLVDSQGSQLKKVPKIRTRNQLYATKLINRRAELLDQEKVLNDATLDRYSFIRDAYLLRRQSLVYDGNPPRPPEEDDDEEDTPAEAPAAPVDSAAPAADSAPAAPVTE